MSSLKNNFPPTKNEIEKLKKQILKKIELPVNWGH